jgi:hypothetical protein
VLASPGVYVRQSPQVQLRALSLPAGRIRLPGRRPT